MQISDFLGCVSHGDLKLEKGPSDKAKEPDPGGSDQQNLGYKKLKNRNLKLTVRLDWTIVFPIFRQTRPDFFREWTAEEKT